MNTEATSQGLAVEGRTGYASLHHNPPMLSRWLAWCVWALVSASVVYWGYLFFAPGQSAPLQAAVAVPKAVQRGDLTRLFGPDEAPKSAADALPPPDKRFTLLGVVAPRARAGSSAAREGIALIAVEGKPAKAYRVGAIVDGDTIVQTVAARSVTLGPRGGPAVVSLDIPPPPVATPAPPGTLSHAVATAPTPAPATTAAPAVPMVPMAAPAPASRPLRGNRANSE